MARTQKGHGYKNIHIFNVPATMHRDIHIIKSSVPGASVNDVILFAIEKFISDIKKRKEIGQDITNLLLKNVEIFHPLDKDYEVDEYAIR